MSGSEYLLGILDAAGEVPSRTMLQKLAYLASAIAEESLGFTPHFYGPYSARLQEDVEAIIEGDLVEEREWRLEPWEPASFDVVQYRYQITEAGRLVAKEIPAPIKHVTARVVRAALEADAWNQASLSLAAKLHHLRRVNPTLGDDQIPILAQEFGWRMTEDTTRYAARLLQVLGPQ